MNDDSDNEFFDATEDTSTIEHATEESINYSLDKNRVLNNLSKRSKEHQSKQDVKPLHERLNEDLNLQKDESNEDLKLQEKDDPYFIDESKLKSEQEDLSVEHLNKMLNDAVSIKEEGNRFFKNGDYDMAVEKYTNALKVCPIVDTKSRAILYSNRSTGFLKKSDIDRCISDCTKAIDLDPMFVKPLQRRAECYENTDKLDEALADHKKLTQLEPKNNAHNSKCFILEQKIHERNEKLKAEMMGKLKDLGNMILKPFGLSTGNFQFTKDENTGSYSVNFKQ